MTAIKREELVKICKEYDKTDIIEFLKKENNLDRYGDCVFRLFCIWNNLDMMKFLIENNLCNYRNAFSMCAMGGDREMIKFFLDKGVDINALYRGTTILNDVLRFGRYKTSKFLIENGADINKSGGNILICTFSHWCKNIVKTIDMLNFLINKGIDDFHNIGYDALLFAVERNKPFEIIKLLIIKGVDIHRNDSEIMRLACIHGRKDVVEYLLQNGVKYDKMNWVMKIRFSIDNLGKYIQSEPEPDIRIKENKQD